MSLNGKKASLSPPSILEREQIRAKSRYKEANFTSLSPGVRCLRGRPPRALPRMTDPTPSDYIPSRKEMCESDFLGYLTRDALGGLYTHCIACIVRSRMYEVCTTVVLEAFYRYRDVMRETALRKVRSRSLGVGIGMTWLSSSKGSVPISRAVFRG